ncbi:hypothetical protein Ddye_018732 [Dipteronia dyeriana]|uniref:Uncharacterized protein n=1 Tax=Dipteronia dyeriana TaxID=168575 RepID=A0AAD9X1Y8_9ROSI|nr:hypothetical protein Ddye_018732 [Dipteronia dyeriana]
MPSTHSRGVPTSIGILYFHSSMPYRDVVRRDDNSPRAMLDISWRGTTSTIFTFEVIPQLDKVFGTRRVTDLSPRLLK